MNVLFVCIGSTCRSPAAAELARMRCPSLAGSEAAGIRVRSMGAPPDPRMQKQLKAMGRDISAMRARPFVIEDFDRFDCVFALEKSVLDWLDAMAPGRARLLLEAAGLGAEDVPDPYDTGDYEAAIAQISEAVDRLCAAGACGAPRPDQA